MHRTSKQTNYGAGKIYLARSAKVAERAIYLNLFFNALFYIFRAFDVQNY